MQSEPEKSKLTLQQILVLPGMTSELLQDVEGAAVAAALFFPPLDLNAAAANRRHGRNHSFLYQPGRSGDRVKSGSPSMRDRTVK